MELKPEYYILIQPNIDINSAKIKFNKHKKRTALKGAKEQHDQICISTLTVEAVWPQPRAQEGQSPSPGGMLGLDGKGAKGTEQWLRCQV